MSRKQFRDLKAKIWNSYTIDSNFTKEEALQLIELLTKNYENAQNNK